MADVSEYLKVLGSNDYALLTEKYASETLRAEAGEMSSLSVTPSWLDASRPRPNITEAVSVDAGGTNLRVAKVTFADDGSAVLGDIERYPIPGKDKAVSAEEFFETLGNYILSCSPDASDVGVSFAYKGTITPEKDYIIYGMCKEVEITGIEGRSLAGGLNGFFERKCGRKKNIVTVNDTAACLIGAAGKDLSGYGAAIGMVLGTGFNICYLRDMEKVPGYGRDSGRDVIISEAGFWDGAERGTVDVDLDLASQLPGDHIFEKMISGQYLPVIYNSIMKKAFADGACPDAYINEDADGSFLSELIASEDASEEAVFARSVAKAVTGRAARLAASAVAGAVIASCGEKKNAVIVAEGSTVLKTTGFLKDFTDLLDAELTEKRGITYRIATADNGVLLGTAGAVLM